MSPGFLTAAGRPSRISRNGGKVRLTIPSGSNESRKTTPASHELFAAGNRQAAGSLVLVDIRLKRQWLAGDLARLVPARASEGIESANYNSMNLYSASRLSFRRQAF
jgi:hypothetical protein